MGKRRSKRRRVESRPVGQIDPRSATLDELVAMIQRVNPTDRGVPAREAASRYARKSELQDLLIHRFGDQLEAVPESDDHVVVLLRQRASQRSACHALVEELDDEARRWVRAQLDAQSVQQSHLSLGGAEPLSRDDEARAVGGPADALEETEVSPATRATASGTPAEEPLPDSPTELVALGHQAMEAYDYDRARRCFRAGLTRGGGHSAAAAPLLELLVDYLAAYQEAYELRAHLSPRARRDPHVRLLLGLASAQVADRPQALADVAGSEDPRAVDVYLLLARAALADGDDTEAGEHLTRARALSGSDPRIEELATTLRARQADIRRPLERAVTERFERGDTEGAQRQAEEILQRWPDSATARRVLTDLRRQRRRARFEALQQAVEQAMRASQFERAAQLSRQALELDASSETMQHALAEAEEQLRKAAERASLTRVNELLRQGDSDSALPLYVALAEPLRAQVRRHNDTPELRWLEQMDAPRANSRAQRRACEAAIALRRAQRALDDDQPEEAVGLLEAKMKLLKTVEDAHELQARSAARIAQLRQHATRRGLDRTEQALADGDLGSARELLATVSLAGLTAADKQRIRELEQAVRARETTLELERRYERDLAADDLLAARQGLNDLLSRADDATERQQRQRQLGSLREQIRAQWRVQVVQSPGLEDLGSDRLGDVRDSAAVWLTPDGARVMLVDSWSHWLFIRELNLEAGRIESAVFMQAPWYVGEHGETLVDSRGLWIETEQGRLINVDPEDWDIRSSCDVGELLPTSERFERILLPPNSRYVWLEAMHTDTHAMTTRVVDLRSRRVRRELPEGTFPMPLLGPSLMVTSRRDKKGVLDTRGSLVAADFEIPGEDFCQVTLHPSGCGVVTAPDEDRGANERILLRVAVPGARAAVDLGPGSEDLTVQSLATSLDNRLTHMLVSGASNERELITLRCTEGSAELELLYRVAAPPDTALITDADARQVVALGPGRAGIQAVVVNDRPPELCWPDAAHRAALDGTLPALDRFYACSELHGPIRAQALALQPSLNDLARPAIPAWVESYRGQHTDSSQDLLAATIALKLCRAYAEAESLRRWIWKHHPESPDVRLDEAMHLAEERKWSGVRRLLESVDRSPMSDSAARHCCHLLGIALYRAGEVEQASTVWRAGLAAEEGECELQPLLDLVALFSADKANAPQRQTQSPNTPTLTAQLVSAIQTADRALAGGYPEVAIERLEQPGLRSQREIQSAARLAAAYLACQSRSPTQGYKKAAALARFCQLAPANKRVLHCELPLPGATWDQTRLDELCAEARAWLDQCVLEHPPAAS